MPKKLDLSGKVFSLWTVLEEVYGVRPTKWKCTCECGSTGEVLTNNLMMGKSRSCGCIGNTKMIARNKNNAIHGLSGTGIQYLWKSVHTFQMFIGLGIKIKEEKISRNGAYKITGIQEINTP